MAIDSPLSPIFSNVYVEDLEQKAVDTYHLKPKNVVEICQDTYMVLVTLCKAIRWLLQHLNKLEESIKFTMEVEKKNRIPIRNVLVYK